MDQLNSQNGPLTKESFDYDADFEKAKKKFIEYPIKSYRIHPVFEN